MHLLLVEDDSMNVELFQDVLEEAGHSVTIARDGLEGRDVALVSEFDVILMDIQLPGMTGDLVCRALRAGGVTSPILALSANVLQHQIDSCMAAGFDAYLTKPIRPNELRNAVLQFGEPAAPA